MSHCTTRSFEIICHGRKIGLADYMMRSFYFETMYHILSTISDILRQGVDSLAEWLEHRFSTPVVRIRIPSGT